MRIGLRWQRAPGGALLLAACTLALMGGCTSRADLQGPVPQPGPHDLVARSSTRLRSATLDVSLRYHDGGESKFPFALFRLKNLTRAPIYANLDRITLRRAGRQEQMLRPACDRDRTSVARLAPREAHWCGKYANPGHSIDLPVGLFEIPPRDGLLEFDLVVPIVFNTGEPVPVTFSNRVDRDDWRISAPQGRVTP